MTIGAWYLTNDPIAGYIEYDEDEGEIKCLPNPAEDTITKTIYFGEQYGR